MIRLREQTIREFKPNSPHQPDWTGGNSPSTRASGANSLLKLWTRVQADEERGKRDKVERKAGPGRLEADQQQNKGASLITTHGVHMHLLMSERECIKTCWQNTHLLYLSPAYLDEYTYCFILQLALFFNIIRDKINFPETSVGEATLKLYSKASIEKKLQNQSQKQKAANYITT